MRIQRRTGNRQGDARPACPFLAFLSDLSCCVKVFAGDFHVGFISNGSIVLRDQSAKRLRAEESKDAQGNIRWPAIPEMRWWR
jgi:hypothetical protein